MNSFNNYLPGDIFYLKLFTSLSSDVVKLNKCNKYVQRTLISKGCQVLGLIIGYKHY